MRPGAFWCKASLGRRGDRASAEIDRFANCDYSDHMTATLRETKAKLSEMVRRASQGEEVVITVHGKQMARLVGVPKRAKKLDKKKWLAKLARLRRQTGTGIVGMTAQEIQDEDRADRF
jgi:prevent-host-death family protein